MKKLLFSLVLALTDGATNAGCALALQFLDSCTILLARPHIGRDDDIVECFGAVSNFLTCTWLVVPVMFQGAVTRLFSDQFTMMLALFSTVFAAAVSILTPFMAAVKWLSEISANLVQCLGPAADGLAIFFLHIGAIAEGEMRDKMNRKYLRDLNKEEKCIRLQLLLQTRQAFLKGSVAQVLERAANLERHGRAHVAKQLLPLANHLKTNARRRVNAWRRLL